VGIPAAAFLSLRQSRGVWGLWAGLVAGAALQLVVLAVVMGLQDWPVQVERSKLLVSSQSSLRSSSRGDGGPEGLRGTAAAWVGERGAAGGVRQLSDGL